MSLEDFFSRTRSDLESALAAARAELDMTQKRAQELEALIARALATLGQPPPPPTSGTLHEALEFVLADRGNAWMSAGELAQSVNAQGLYRMRDGRPVQASQIHARVRNYDGLFERSEGKIRLRYTLSTSDAPKTGAYAAAVTTATPADEASLPMEIEFRVAYSVQPPERSSIESLARDQAEMTARRLIVKGEVAPGVRRRYLMATTGTIEIAAGE